jgi:hypothetical protein
MVDSAATEFDVVAAEVVAASVPSGVEASGVTIDRRRKRKAINNFFMV